MIALALTALSLNAFAPQQAGSEPLPDPALEMRVQKLGKQLRCAVCQGMSISDSPAQMARAQLDKVREMVAAGQSDQEIKDYFVQRYDEWVLLEPKREGFTLVVWIGPIFALLLGLGLVAWYVRSHGSTVKAPPPPSGERPGETAPLSGEDPYVQAVRAELDR